MNYYLIMARNSSIYEKDPLVRAKNSKEALEKLIGKKVKRVLGYYEVFDYSVRLSDERGYTHRDRRHTTYYKVIK
jgi:hypothetical protein